MLGEVLGVYVGLLISSYVSTMVLILSKRSWGSLPNIYIKLIEWLQNYLTEGAPSADEGNNNTNEPVIGKHHLTPTSIKNLGNDPFQLSMEMMRSGIECILQDDLERPFESSPTDAWLLMSSPPTPQFTQNLVYGLSVSFRWGFLFPLRMMFLFSALFWALTTGIFVAMVPSTSRRTVNYFAITFAKLMSASIGMIVKGYCKENRPKAPGIAVANHISANDVFTIYSDCDYEGYSYTVTGQKHGGLAGLLEKLGEKLTHSLWMDREDMRDRANFQKKVISYASNSDVDPVLLFPEGFCSNNTTVLQFRKAVFTGEVPIYPVAFLQNSRVGDAFWKEDTFIPYVIRVMTSFATLYEIYYMPPMEQKETEDAVAFAGRVQSAIAAKVGITALPYDGGLKRAKNRLVYQQKIQTVVYEQLFMQ